MSHKIFYFKSFQEIKFLKITDAPLCNFSNSSFKFIYLKGSCNCGHYVLLFYHNYHLAVNWHSLYTACYVSEMKLLRTHGGIQSIPWWWGLWLWTQKDAPTSEYQYWLGLAHPKSFLSAAAWPEWWGHPALPSRIVSLSFWFSWLALMEVSYLCLWRMCYWQCCAASADLHQTEEG